MNYYLLIFSFLCSSSKAKTRRSAMGLEKFDGKSVSWTECLNTRFPLPTLLCTGYSGLSLSLPTAGHTPLQRTLCHALLCTSILYRGVEAQVTVNATDCLFDSLWRKWYIQYFHVLALLMRQSAALTSAIQHTIPPEFVKRREEKSLNGKRSVLTLCYQVKIPLSNLLYSVELKKPGIEFRRPRKILK